MTRQALVDALPHLYVRLAPGPSHVPGLRAAVRSRIVEGAWAAMDQIACGESWPMHRVIRYRAEGASQALRAPRLWVTRSDRPDGRESFYVTESPLPGPETEAFP